MEKVYRRFKLIPVCKLQRKRDNNKYFYYLKKKKYYQKMKQAIGKETIEELQVLWSWKILTITLSFILLFTSILFYKSLFFTLLVGVSGILMVCSYILNKKLHQLYFYYKITHEFLDILRNEENKKNSEND
jgi:ABC-type multidrug transport system permease subunit